MSNAFAPITSDARILTVRQFTGEMADVTKADYAFQSRVRWKDSNKKSFITSLILGMAPSKFIFASTQACSVSSVDKVDVEYYTRWFEKKKVHFLNIDSNNRVTCLKEFLAGKFGIETGFYEVNGQVIEIKEGKNDTIDTLPLLIRDELFHAKITIELVTRASRSQLSDLFIRLNDGMSLNGPEKRNAVICKFSSACRKLAEDVIETKIFDTLFSNNDRNRRKVDDYLAGLAIIYNHGLEYKISEKHLWYAYQSDSTEDKFAHKFVEFFEKFLGRFGDDLKAIPNRNSLLDIFAIYKDFTDDGYYLQDPKGFLKEFLKVHTAATKSKEEYKISEGRNAVYSEFLRSREVGFNIVRRDVILKDFNPLQFCVQRDSKRTFNKEERLGAAVKQGWVTPEGVEIPLSELQNPEVFAGSHIEPWGDGGQTTPENAAIQTKDDNLKTGKNRIEGM